MRICIQSLGCPKNLVDSEVLAGYLLGNQYTLTNDLENCDIALINTCSFIQPAVEESIETILEAARLKEEGKIKYILVAGCLPQRYKNQELIESLPEVDAFIGIDEISKINEIVDKIKNGESLFQVNLKPHYIYNENSLRFLFTPSHYAYLKISEGCNNNCTYCLIPQIKGRYRSRTIDSVFSEAEKLIENYNVKELVLIAEDTTYYGMDIYGKLSLSDLLIKLTQLKWSEQNRIRILYTHPAHYSDELIDVLAQSKVFCPYLDIPLQHISNSILKRMNRKVEKRDIIALIEKLREKIPGITLRSTFIVGFPGETEEEFQELCDFVEQYRLEKVGVFTYYNEEGCAAYRYQDQIPENIKQKRLDTLMKIQQKIALTKQKEKIGKILTVLIDGLQEDNGNNVITGRSCAEAPEIDGYITVSNGRKRDIGNWVKVEIKRAFPYHLEGKIVK